MYFVVFQNETCLLLFYLLSSCYTYTSIQPIYYKSRVIDMFIVYILNFIIYHVNLMFECNTIKTY